MMINIIEYIKERINDIIFTYYYGHITNYRIIDNMMCLDSTTKINNYFYDSFFRTYVNSYVIKSNLKLNLENAFYYADVNKSVFDNVHKFSINFGWCYRSKITNANMFEKIQILNLSNCCNITDVSSLKNTQIIDISHCIKINDISMLISVNNLNLEHCKKITNISNLTNIEYLNICFCDKIIYIGNLCLLKTLLTTHYTYGIHLLKNINNIKINRGTHYNQLEKKILKRIKIFKKLTITKQIRKLNKYNKNNTFKYCQVSWLKNNNNMCYIW